MSLWILDFQGQSHWNLSIRKLCSIVSIHHMRICRVAAFRLKAVTLLPACKNFNFSTAGGKKTFLPLPRRRGG